MHFSDDDLSAALRREDPGPEFTERVISAIQRSGRDATSEQPRWKRSWWPFRLSPALAGVAAAVVLIAASWLGLALYNRHQAEIARAEKARQEAILALRITNAKLNHVFRRVNFNQQAAPQPKNRRQIL